MAKWGSERYKIAFRDYVLDFIEWSLKKKTKMNLESRKVEVGKSKNI